MAKLIDAEQTDFTQIGTTIGTPAYMSPEQARGDKIDRRSDIYSLGCIAYTMILGRPPYKAESSPALIHKVVYEPPTPPQDLDPTVPPGVIYALERVLAKEPQMRYSSAAVFVQALREGVDLDPVGHHATVAVSCAGTGQARFVTETQNASACGRAAAGRSRLGDCRRDLCAQPLDGGRSREYLRGFCGGRATHSILAVCGLRGS